MRKYGLILILVLTASICSAQVILKGNVTDTIEKKNLHHAVVSVLRTKDSMLVNFARTNDRGDFEMKLPAGKYTVLFSFPKYADFADEVNIDASKPVVDMGRVTMIQQSVLLQEVIVRQNVAIRIKGDTIEYKADSFKVHEGANVQDLLRRMPGLQVDRNGQITAQGQKVEKVLVDGEEFFSDDPAVVTKNLRADAIDKVQSFDKKSDQAEFTGIDDGSRSKTLNLVLKDDKKKGLFGKLSVAAGTEERYSNEAMFNFFKGKKKASFYGIMSNTGKIGLDWEDRDKFGSGSGWGDGDVEVGAGFIMISGGDYDEDFEDWDSEFYGNGIPRALKAGAHFSNKWSQDKQHLNGNYSILSQNTDIEGSTRTKYILPDSAYYQNRMEDRQSFKLRQLLTGFYDFKLDSFSSIKLRVNGNNNHTENNGYTEQGSDDENLNPVNRNFRSNNSVSDQRALQGSILWKQRLKKAGRTFSLNLSHKYSDRESEGFLFSVTDYYNATGQVFNTDSIDQKKTVFNKTQTSGAKAVYTEPLSKKTTLELNTSWSRNATESDRKSFDKVNGKYEDLNEIFSNKYELEYLSKGGGTKIQYNSKKFVANIGMNVMLSEYNQDDSLGKRVRHFEYTNLFPSARINFKFGPQKGLNFNYSGSTRPPSIDQINPVLENEDPLNIIIGNPNLEQSFQHHFSGFYNDFKVLTGRSIWMNFYGSTTSHAIVSSLTIDQGGKRTQQYVNADGVYSYGGWLSYGFKFKNIDLNFGINSNFNGGRFVSYVNSIKNINKNLSAGIGLNMGKYKDEDYNFNIESRVRYNTQESSISIGRTTSFISHEHNFNFRKHIDKKWSIASDVSANFREKTSDFANANNVINLNAEITRKLLKKNNLELTLSAEDILNQRKGIERSIEPDYVVERNYQVLRRYFLLKVEWNFSKSPGQTK